jgi:hypothetical protein
MSAPFLTLSEEVVTRAHDTIQTRWAESKEAGRAIALLPEPPGRAELRVLLEQAFWASLQTEEGRPATFSLCWVDPLPLLPFGLGLSRLVLEEPIPLTVDAIRKLAPALVSGNTNIGVTRGGQPGDLVIWGLSRGDHFELEVRVVRPGFLTLEYGHERTVVFLGQEAWPIPRFSSALGLIESALPQSLGQAERSVLGAVLLGLTREMRRHGSGGALVLLPRSAGDPWNLTNPKYKLRRDEARRWFDTADLVRKIEDLVGKRQEGAERSPLAEGLAYALAPYHVPELRGLLTGDPHEMTPALASTVAAVGKLTAVDGAVLLDDESNVLSFGTRLLSDSDRKVRLLASGAVSRREPTKMQLHELGGTRHESAVRFVNEVPGAVALVASHDGDFTIIMWNAEKNAVLAYRNVHLLLD